MGTRLNEATSALVLIRPEWLLFSFKAGLVSVAEHLAA